MNLFYINELNYKNIVSYKQIIINGKQTTFICGKSGSGKSTLLKLLNASISAISGELLYRDKPIADYDTIFLRREITLVSQNVFLFDDSIKNNFSQYYSFREQQPPNDEKIKEYLKLCMINFSPDTNCRDMSCGERQRVFISVCLSFNPKVLMLDEPTSALDYKTSDCIMRNIKNYCGKNGISLIVITHDKTLAKQYADKIIDLNTEE